MHDGLLVVCFYVVDPTGKLFTIELNYGGVLIGNSYSYGHIAYKDMVDPDKLSLHEFNRMAEFMGVYGGIFEYLWMLPGQKILDGLKPLHCGDDVRELADGVTTEKTIHVFINKLSEFQARRRLAQIQMRMFEVVTKRSGVVIEEVMQAGGLGNSGQAKKVSIHPLNDSAQWLPGGGAVLRAPTFEPRLSGPIQKKRKESVGEFETTKKDKRGRTYQSIKKSGQKQHCSVCNKEGHNKRVHGQEASNNGAGPSSRPNGSPTTVNSSGQASVSSPRVGTHASGSTFVPTPTGRVTRSKTTPTVRVTRSKMAALCAGNQV
ncbi:hypothetical protein LINPERPRIM_LOCUS33550 [Linum perenne]